MKRVAINSNTKQEGKDGEILEMTSGFDVSSPTKAIIAFGWNGENQILKSGKNKWENLEGRDWGVGFASVRGNQNVFIIGGLRGLSTSNCTNIYNIVTSTWSDGPTLNIARLDKYSSQLILHVSMKPNAFCNRNYLMAPGLVKWNTFH